MEVAWQYRYNSRDDATRRRPDALPSRERRNGCKLSLIADLSGDAFTRGALAVGAPVAEKRQTLNVLSPDVVDLLNRLGLSGLSPPAGGIVDTLGSDLKKRQILNDLFPEVVDLLNRLGLSGLSPPAGSVVDTLGSDLKKRAPVGGIVETLGSDLKKR
ncbi:hypothetical protein DPSP01_006706 [Paraphaeosphaeria sporulosa]